SRSVSSAATPPAPATTSPRCWPTSPARHRRAGRTRAPATPGGRSPRRCWSSCSCSRPSALSPMATTPGRSRSSPSCSSSSSRGAGRGAAGPRGARVAEHPALVAVQRAIAVLTMAPIATQFFLAGAGAFGATSFDAHKTVGSALVLVVLLALVVATLARRHTAHAAILVGVTVLQRVLGSLGTDTPWIGAFHGLNALVVLAVAGTLVRKAFATPAAGARAATS